MTNAETMNRQSYGTGTVPTDLERLDDLDDWQIAEGESDPRGCDLIGSDGDTIGRIEGLLASPTTQTAHFAVVDTGGLFSNERFLLPLEAIALREGNAYCPFTKGQFKDAPEWHEKDRYFGRHESYWMGLGAGQAPAGDAAAYRAGSSDGAAASRDEEVVIPVVEEELQVGKRQVERGGVRINRRVTESPVEETVRLREEQVHVERHPVDRPLSDRDGAAFRDGFLEVKAVSEEPVVRKAAHVVEEVVVGKEVLERTETVQDTVRRTDVDVEAADELQPERTGASRP